MKPKNPFSIAWTRINGGLRDSWGVEYVYERGARRIWNAAIRYERKRRAEGKPGSRS
jgi:hypothetical protein